MPKQFHDRYFPVRPNLEQLRHQAKDLLRAIRRMAPDAVAELRKHRLDIEPDAAKLADVQYALARSYGLPSWARLVTACRMTDAIWRGDTNAVRELIVKDPKLLHEAARGVADSNWGPPMSYAANVGQDEIITMLREMGATDTQHAFDRACLQGKIETASTPPSDGRASTARLRHGSVRDSESGGVGVLVRTRGRTCRCPRRSAGAGRAASTNLLPWASA